MTILLAQVAGAVVIDHYGVYGEARPGQRRRHAACSICVRHPHVWMKLSAPYRHDRRADEHHARPRMAGGTRSPPRRDRCVWGSDWPHPPAHEQHKGRVARSAVPRAVLRRAGRRFFAALPSPRLADRIMRDNAARLYGF